MIEKKLAPKASASQQLAHAKHDEARRELPRLPGTRLLNEEDAAVMERLYSRFETKYEAIITAAKHWLENNK